MFDELFEKMREQDDPVIQFELASRLQVLNQQLGVEIARVRRGAIEKASEMGMNNSRFADEVDLTRGRITQIKKKAPPRERIFWGYGPVEIYVAERLHSPEVVSSIHYHDLLYKSLAIVKKHLDNLQIRYNIHFVEGSYEKFCDNSIILGTADNLKEINTIAVNESKKNFEDIFLNADGNVKYANDLDGFIARSYKDGKKITLISGKTSHGMLIAAKEIDNNILNYYDKYGEKDCFFKLV